MPEVLGKPKWLKARVPGGEGFAAVRATVEGHRLHTVCESARCPNQGECWNRGTATLMILGDVCTRACGFCAIKTGRPPELDLKEPARVAEAIKLMNLRHVVITSVARDELADGGSGVWAATILAVRETCPSTRIEVLIPDFMGRAESWNRVFEARPDILNHNLETVPRLTPAVRSAATWERSLALLEAAKAFGLRTKTGLMLGLGETEQELKDGFARARRAGVDILTLGQYLQPTPAHLPVKEFVPPERFAFWKGWCLDLGFKVVESGPLVRSSYHADEQSEGLVGT